MKIISVEEMNDACDKEYNENYSHGGYCHEQSFRFGFQEGVEFAEKKVVTKILNKARVWLNNEFYDNQPKVNFIEEFCKAMKE